MMPLSCGLDGAREINNATNMEIHDMSQDLINLTFAQEELAQIDQALETLETRLAGLTSLKAETRRNLTKMGGKSETFCRQTIHILGQNPEIVPPNLRWQSAEQDLATLDQLRPRTARLQRLVERAVDSQIALGSDVMRVALDGYAVIKVSGKAQGLKALRQALSTRFIRGPRRSTNEAE